MRVKQRAVKRAIHGAKLIKKPKTRSISKTKRLASGADQRKSPIKQSQPEKTEKKSYSESKTVQKADWRDQIALTRENV